MKLLAFDYGRKRTGLAETDELQIIASALQTIETPKLFEFLKFYLEKNSVEAFIVGEPKRLNNERTDSSDIVDQFVNRLRKVYPQIPIHRVDERFTSKMAFQTMIDSGIGKKKRRDKGTVDRISATLILQSYMESKQGGF
ncbi:MAG: Holliday junction resolvase RuvX [Crocinitomicaceae bacterium]|nr:Holliday junction resolvase RuvX [Crocinitomicaceae bacterium]